MKILKRAQKFAKLKHKYQKDKAGEDYFTSHVKVVADKVENAGYSVEYVAVAYLHDVVEDTDTTITDISNIFGDGISNAISAITKQNNESYDEYIERVQTNKIATIVKYYDMEHNSDLSRLEKISEIDLNRKKKYRKNMEKIKSYLHDKSFEPKDIMPFYQTKMYIQAEYLKLAWKRFNWFLFVEAGMLSLYFTKLNIDNEFVKIGLFSIGITVSCLWLVMGIEDQKSALKHKIKGKIVENIFLDNYFTFPRHNKSRHSNVLKFRQTSLLWMSPFLIIAIWIYIFLRNI